MFWKNNNWKYLFFGVFFIGVLGFLGCSIDDQEVFNKEDSLRMVEDHRTDFEPNDLAKMEVIDVVTENSEVFQVYVASSVEEKQRGFSGILIDDMQDVEGMLFVYDESGERSFWMLYTFFDLDVFYLDRDGRVIEVVRDLPKFSSLDASGDVPRAPVVFAYSVLELPSESFWAHNLEKGDILKFVTEK